MAERVFYSFVDLLEQWIGRIHNSAVCFGCLDWETRKELRPNLSWLIYEKAWVFNNTHPKFFYPQGPQHTEEVLYFIKLFSCCHYLFRLFKDFRLSVYLFCFFHLQLDQSPVRAAFSPQPRVNTPLPRWSTELQRQV